MTPRIYTVHTLAEGDSVQLSQTASHHICTVLRLSAGAALTLFNGDGLNYSATLQRAGKQASAKVISATPNHNESNLRIHLLQGLSRADRMDTTIQKAVELGVSAITPLLTQKSQVKLPPERAKKKMQHWQAIIIGACEQSGRSVLPVLHVPIKLQQYLDASIPDDNQTRFVLNPGASVSLGNVHLQHSICHVLVGPESGLSDSEIAQCIEHGCNGVALGPRILRTETAGASALAILQARFGDLR